MFLKPEYEYITGWARYKRGNTTGGGPMFDLLKGDHSSRQSEDWDGFDANTYLTHHKYITLPELITAVQSALADESLLPLVARRGAIRQPGGQDNWVKETKDIFLLSAEALITREGQVFHFALTSPSFWTGYKQKLVCIRQEGLIPLTETAAEMLNQRSCVSG